MNPGEHEAAGVHAEEALHESDESG